MQVFTVKDGIETMGIKRVERIDLESHYHTLTAIPQLCKKPKQLNMKLLSILSLCGLTSVVSAAIGQRCSGSPPRPCLCLDNRVCKGIGGTPVEKYSGGGFPCPSDASNIWGCYIYCD